MIHHMCHAYIVQALFYYAIKCTMRYYKSSPTRFYYDDQSSVMIIIKNVENVIVISFGFM